MFRLTSNRCTVAETNIRKLKGVEFLYFKLSKFLQTKFFLFKVELLKIVRLNSVAIHLI